MKTTLKAELAGNGEEEKSEGGAGMRGILPTPSVSVAAAGKTLDFASAFATKKEKGL